MLITTGILHEPAPYKNNGNKLAFSRNNNSKPALRRNDGNNEVDRFDIGENDVKHAKKLRKLSNSRKLKIKKMSKFQNLAKPGKKLSRNRILTNFNITEDGIKFLTLNTRTSFNC